MDAPPKFVVFKRVDRLGHGQPVENTIKVNDVFYKLVDPEILTTLIPIIEDFIMLDEKKNDT